MYGVFGIFDREINNIRSYMEYVYGSGQS